MSPVITPPGPSQGAAGDNLVKPLIGETGRRVTGVALGWGLKNIEGQKAAFAELQRSRVGRKARITGTVEEMLPGEVIEWHPKPFSSKFAATHTALCIRYRLAVEYRFGCQAAEVSGD